MKMIFENKNKQVLLWYTLLILKVVLLSGDLHLISWKHFKTNHRLPIELTITRLLNYIGVVQN